MLSVINSRINNTLFIMFKQFFVALMVCIIASTTALAQQDEKSTNLEQRPASNLDELLKLIEDRQLHWTKENEQRERRFQQNKSVQKRLLRDAERERENERDISQKLENRFDENELRLTNLLTQMHEREGGLRELFGVLQQVSGDAQSVFATSLVSAEYPGRGAWLQSLASKMGKSTELASIEEIERLWYELQREMTETGKVSQFTATIDKEETQVIRVGGFNLIADGKYVRFISNPDNQSIEALSRQPSSRYTSTAKELSSAGPSTTVPFGFDPTRGSLLSLLIQSKTLEERIEDGGGVGYLIISLGIIGVALAIFQLTYVYLVGVKVNNQRNAADSPKDDNPLGRIMIKAEANKSVDLETLELKMTEAILEETPRLNRFLSIIQVISAVSPLLGLLGTVIGMIQTFQAITLFGTGDPQIMAGGISTALMTTVLGLCAAIPTVLLHSVVSSRSKAVLHVLEEQSVGIIAEQSEQIGRATGQSTK